jgi:hypothetical protein
MLGTSSLWTVTAIGFNVTVSVTDRTTVLPSTQLTSARGPVRDHLEGRHQVVLPRVAEEYPVAACQVAVLQQLHPVPG